jgi:hypothetical protein
MKAFAHPPDGAAGARVEHEKLFFDAEGKIVQESSSVAGGAKRKKKRFDREKISATSVTQNPRPVDAGSGAHSVVT